MGVLSLHIIQSINVPWNCCPQENFTFFGAFLYKVKLQNSGFSGSEADLTVKWPELSKFQTKQSGLWIGLTSRSKAERLSPSAISLSKWPLLRCRSQLKNQNSKNQRCKNPWNLRFWTGLDKGPWEVDGRSTCPSKKTFVASPQLETDIWQKKRGPFSYILPRATSVCPLLMTMMAFHLVRTKHAFDDLLPQTSCLCFKSPWTFC